MTYSASHTIEWQRPLVSFRSNELGNALLSRINHFLNQVSISPEHFLPLVTLNRVHLNKENAKALGIGNNLSWRMIIGANHDLVAFGFTNRNKSQDLNHAIATVIFSHEDKSIRTAGIRDGKIVACQYKPNDMGHYELSHGMVSSPTEEVGMKTPESLQQTTWPYYAGLITPNMLIINPDRLISTRRRDTMTFLCDQSDNGFTSHTHNNDVFIADHKDFNFPLPRILK